MNDPGFDEPLNETQKRMKSERKEEEDFEEEEEQTFLNPRSKIHNVLHLKPLADFIVAVDGGLLPQHSLYLLYASDDQFYMVC